MLNNDYTLNSKHEALTIDGFTSLAIVTASRFGAPFTVWEVIETARGAYETVRRFNTSPVSVWVRCLVDESDPDRRIDTVTVYSEPLENVDVEELRADVLRYYKITVSVNGFDVAEVVPVPAVTAPEDTRRYKVIEVTATRTIEKTFSLIMPDDEDEDDFAREYVDNNADDVFEAWNADDLDDDVSLYVLNDDLTRDNADGYGVENDIDDIDIEYFSEYLEAVEAFENGDE